MYKHEGVKAVPLHRKHLRTLSDQGYHCQNEF